MAKVQWQGSVFCAKPLRRLPNGDWVMEAQEHGNRFCPGTMIRVTEREILDMADSEVPNTAKSMNELIAALEVERKTLPTIDELLRKFREQETKEKGKNNGAQTSQ